MKMLVGGGVAAAGGLITLATYSAASSGGGSYVVLYGAIGFGALNFVIGAAQFLAYSLKSPSARERDGAVLGIQLLLNAMVSVSSADGEIDDTEVSTILAIVHELTQQYIDPASVNELADEIKKFGIPIASTIGDYRERLPSGFDELIVRACYLTAAADGVIAAVERRRIEDISRALRLRPDQLIRIAAASSSGSTGFGTIRW